MFAVEPESLAMHPAELSSVAYVLQVEAFGVITNSEASPAAE